MEINRVDVTFNSSPKSYTFDAGNLQISKGDTLVVETVCGLEVGTASTDAKFCETELAEVKPVIRIATENDIKAAEENRIMAQSIKQKTVFLAEKLGLEMKIVSCELTLNRSKALLCFTSEARVDFRELVKTLAAEFKMRIELRQIGARDEARIVGGLGPCGKPVCCKQFLEDFEHVTIKMAKNQGLSLNPAKISGMCGRLMCCLEYENKYYSEVTKLMPRLSSKVDTPEGEGTVVWCDMLRQRVDVRIKEDSAPELANFALDEISFPKKDK